MQKSATNNSAWWQGLYPRSFQHTHRDGVADIPGIIRRLEYIASLGVDAIWTSSFFKSPMAGFGYDSSDYRDVDPIFDTLQDLDQLLHHSHRLGVNAFRGFLKWRKQRPVLRRGEIEQVQASEQIFSFHCRLGAEPLYAAFNLSASPAKLESAQLHAARPLEGHGLPTGMLQDGELTLPAHGAFFANLP